MSDIDKELVDILQFVTTEHEKGEFGSPCSTHIRFNKNEADRQIREFIKQSNLSLLARIKESGPEDMIAHTKDDGQPRLYYRQIGWNSSNKAWRERIEAIEKEYGSDRLS